MCGDVGQGSERKEKSGSSSDPDRRRADRPSMPEPRGLREALRDREQVLHRLAEALPLGVMQLDSHGRVIYTNQMLGTILNTSRKNTAAEQLSMVVPEDGGLLAQAFEEVLERGQDTGVELRLDTCVEGERQPRECTMRLRALTSSSGEVTGAIAYIADVSESVQSREELRARATLDDVTKCLDRTSTMELFEHLLTDSHGRSRPAVIFVDLDHFKELNDEHGHAVGDELLGIVAKRLVAATRPDDIVGRVGVDEFLVVCPGIPSLEEAVAVATRIANTLGNILKLKSIRMRCRASIGVAWSDERDVDAEVLVARANTAMQRAKRASTRNPVLWHAAK